MVRFCRIALCGWAFAVCLCGCSGQNVEGAWVGPFPLPGASQCRIRIFDDRRFDLSCGTDDWIGAGHYERTRNGLRFSFSALARHGSLVRDVSAIEVDFVGKGNKLELVGGGVWTREHS